MVGVKMRKRKIWDMFQGRVHRIYQLNPVGSVGGRESKEKGKIGNQAH